MGYNATSVSVALATEDPGAMHAICPLTTMKMSLEDVVCMDDGTADDDAIIRENILGGAAADGFNTTCDGPVTMTVICTGTEDEVEELKAVKRNDSPGWKNRPYRDDAMLMAAEGQENFWSKNLTVTSFDIVDMDEDGDANACNTAGCAEGYDVGAYLRGADSNFARVYSDNFAGDFSFVCPKAGQSISVTAFCNTTDIMYDFSPSIYGSIAFDIDDFSCTTPDEDKYVEVVCDAGSPEQSV